MKTKNLFLSLGLFFLLAFSLPAFAMVDLNTASHSELEALPGVGKKLADAIIEKRPFSTVEDLKNVKGVGESKYEKLKSLVSVGGASAPTASRETEKTAPATRDMTKTSRSNNQPMSATSTKLATGEKININTASLEQLEKLPGIGPKKAEAIIQARPFNSIEDVMKVKGIKAGTFAKIKDNLTL